MATTLEKYISSGKTGSSAGGVKSGATKLDKFLGTGESRLQKIAQANDRIAAQNKVYKANQQLKYGEDNINRYLGEVERANSGVWGMINGFLGRGTPTPVLVGDTPEQIAQKTAPRPTFGENVRNLFTGDATKTAYDTIYQPKADAEILDNIKQNNEVIRTLADRNKNEKNPVKKEQRDKSIRYLLDKNQQFSQETGGEIKDKTDMQLYGQALGTALDLTPFLGAGSLGVRAGQAAIRTGAKVIGREVAEKTLTNAGESLTRSAMKEGAAFGALVGGSGEMQNKDTTVRKIITESIKGMVFGGIAGGVLGMIGTRIGSYISKLEKVIDDGKITGEELEEAMVKGGIPEVKKVVDEKIDEPDIEDVAKTSEKSEQKVNTKKASVSQKTQESESKVNDEDAAFVAAVEERFKKSKTNKFRETKDEKGRFTGSTKQSGDAARDDLASSIENRINAIPDNSVENFGYREDLRDIQTKVANAKPADLPAIKAQSDRIAQEILDNRAKKIRPKVDKERKIAFTRTVANESDNFNEFQLNLKKRGEDITTIFKSKAAAEEFFRKNSGAKYRTADPDADLLQEARKYDSAEEFVKAQGDSVFHGGGKPFNSVDDLDFENGFYTLSRTKNQTDETIRSIKSQYETGVASRPQTLKSLTGKDLSDFKKLDAIENPTNAQWERYNQLRNKAYRAVEASRGNTLESKIKDFQQSPATAFGEHVTEFVANFKKPLVYDAKGKGWMDISDGKYGDFTARLVAKARKAGNDGVIIRNINEGFSSKGTLGAEAGLVDDFIALDKSAIKTKSQLTDLWKKAHGEKFRDIGARFEELTGKKLSSAQEAKIKALHKKMFGDDGIEITAQILTPEGHKAFGVYKNKVIKILDGQADPTDTLYHEAVHKYLDLFTTLDEQKRIYLEARKLWKTDNLDELEEKIAENFIRYAKTNEGVVGTMKVLFDQVIDRIKVALKGESQIEALYKDILEGKAKKAAEATSVPPKPTIQPAIEGTGDLVERGVARSLRDRAVAEGMDDFDVPSYRQMDMKEKAKKANDMMDTDPERVKRIALRQEEAPAGDPPEAYFLAWENQILGSKNPETMVSDIIELSQSRIIEEATAMGQRNAMWAARAETSPTAIINKLTKERTGKAVKSVKKEVDEMRKAVRKTVKTAFNVDAAQKLLDKLKC